MALFDLILVTLIIVVIVLLIWSRVMHQTMLDTLREIRSFITEGVEPIE